MRNDKIKVLLYARSAMESQEEPTKNVDEQLRRLRRYAEERQWIVVGETVEARTAGRSRPGLVSLLKSATSHPKPFDALVVEDLSRLSRDAMTLDFIIQRLSLAQVEIICSLSGRWYHHPDKKTVSTIRHIFGWYLGGASPGEIARELNLRHTQRKKRRKSSGG